MKLVQFSRYVEASQISKPCSFHIEGLRYLIEQLILILSYVKRHEKHGYIAHEPVWISMDREDETQLASLFLNMEEEPLDWSVAYSTDGFEDTTFWHRSECAMRNSRREFYLSIGKLCITCQLDKDCVVVNQDSFLNSTKAFNQSGDTEISLLVHWMIDSLVHEYTALIEKGEVQYYQDKSVPIEFRFSYMPYAEFVKYNHGDDCSPNYIIGELSHDEIVQFNRIARQLSGENSHGISLCKNTYLALVKQAYIAAGLQVDNLNDIESYQRYADGRDGGLLAVADNDESAFLAWFYSDEWQGCHPFEIIRGYRSDNRIVLQPVYQCGGFAFNFFVGDDLSCAARAIRISLKLASLNIPFAMHQALRYMNVLNGKAMVGIIPVGHDYLLANLFPQTDEKIEVVAVEYFETIKSLNIPSNLISSYPLSVFFN